MTIVLNVGLWLHRVFRPGAIVMNAEHNELHILDEFLIVIVRNVGTPNEVFNTFCILFYPDLK
jgi:hypothetical protein